MSRVTARTVRRHRHKVSADLVLHGIRKSTFRKYWNFNVLEMVPLLFILRYFTNIFFKIVSRNKIRN